MRKNTAITMTIDTDFLLDLCKTAGDEILKIYHASEGIAIDRKADNSPLTKADQASHHVIFDALRKHYPDTPIISEEGKEVVVYETRKDYRHFWLVDPLDGTKEFINRNGEFTVNIALIEDGYPVAGFIYVPVKDTWYYTKEGKAYKRKGTESFPIEVNNKTADLTAVGSKSHSSPEEATLLSKYPVTNTISVGSSLKFCMVAEGKADIYYRHGPTMEWDTAAGQAIVEAAGGKVLKGDGESKERFSYNKEELLNKSFLCLGF